MALQLVYRLCGSLDRLCRLRYSVSLQLVYGEAQWLSSSSIKLQRLCGPSARLSNLRDSVDLQHVYGDSMVRRETQWLSSSSMVAQILCGPPARLWRLGGPSACIKRLSGPRDSASSPVYTEWPQLFYRGPVAPSSSIEVQGSFIPSIEI